MRRKPQLGAKAQLTLKRNKAAGRQLPAALFYRGPTPQAWAVALTRGELRAHCVKAKSLLLLLSSGGRTGYVNNNAAVWSVALELLVAW